MRLRICLGVVLLAAGSLPAQHTHPATPSKPATLLPGLGEFHHSITTRSAVAQKFFDQGLVLLYGFNHDEAARSFRRAAELDPDAAMPWWGLALALGPNYNLPEVDTTALQTAHEAVEKARARAVNASEKERAYIGALAARYPSTLPADRKTLNESYSRAMRALAQKFPDDLDAATLFAESLMNLRPWQLWTGDGKPAPGTEEIMRVLESVLHRDPNHPGANHYYVHTVEASPRPELALASAQRLRELVPGAGHLVHMPAHIFFRTGDYAGAAAANESAIRADEQYFALTEATPFYRAMYFNHNLHFLAMARAEEGRSDEALRAAERTAQGARELVKEMPMADSFAATPLFVLLRLHQWEAILRQPEPESALQVTRAIWRFARATALAARGEREKAVEERRAFSAARKTLPPDRPINANNPATTVLEVAGLELDARLAPNTQESVALLRKAVAAQDTLIYDEPPGWYHPVRESLGAALLRAGRSAEAEQSFRDDIARNPGNARSLFGLWQSLAAQKRSAEAEAARRDFEAAWKNATVKLRLEDL